MLFYQSSDVSLYQGDCLEVLLGLADNSVDSVVTDPPYGLSFMGKKWDYDVPAVEVWAECLRVLKPGGHLLSFAGTRTQHRMACRIEDAGFEIRDMIAWVYGSGYPKSLDISVAVDESFGHVRYDKEHKKLPPVSKEGRYWDGYGSALKPALEPITLARKPLIGTVAANVLTHGTGGINVDGCRIGTTVETWPKHRSYAAGQLQPGGYGITEEAGPAPAGRWPANLIHDGSPEVVGLFPQAGANSTGSGGKAARPYDHDNKIFGKGIADNHTPFDYRDSGSAARFFYTAKCSKEDRDEGLRAFGRATAGEMTGGREEGSAGLNNPRAGAGRTQGGKNIHPTVKPTALMRYLCRLVTPPGGVVLDPFMGSGSTGKAALIEKFRFIGIEREAEYMEIAKARVFSGHAYNLQETLL